jgi:hypothetical protein
MKNILVIFIMSSILYGIFHILTNKPSKYLVGDCVKPLAIERQSEEDLVLMKIDAVSRLQYEVTYIYKKNIVYRTKKGNFLAKKGLDENSYKIKCDDKILIEV